MFRSFARAIVPLLLVAMVSACGETYQQPPTVVPTATPVGLQTPPPGAVYLGAYVPPIGGSISTLEAIAGRTLALDAHYYAWLSLFPHLPETADVENGRYSVESWDCGIPDAALASGSADMLITTRAQSLKALGHPVFLRFFWDMNLPSTTTFPYSGLSRTGCYDPKTDGPNGAFSAKEFVAAWTHMRQIFAAQGVTNVIWVWDVAASGSSPAAYYPGSSEVDWIGVDTYEAQTGSFSSLFGPTYTFAAQYGKPILIGETGAVDTNQANFLSGIPTALQTSFPLVQGLMYFDGENNNVNYALGTQGGTAAFTAMAAAPYMSAMGTP